MVSNLRPSPTTAVLIALGALVLVGALSACQSAGEMLGMSKALPDEYAVTVGPNLAVPPDVGLRPPSAGSETSAGADGAAIVFGGADVAVGTPSNPTTLTNLSAGEYALLEQAHAITSNAAIRQILGEPLPPAIVPGAGAEFVPSGPASDKVIDDFFDDLMFWEGATGDLRDDAVIDATREAERLEQNAAEGRYATEGATPVLSDGESSP
jgi:hypothetical protein